MLILSTLPLGDYYTTSTRIKAVAPPNWDAHVVIAIIIAEGPAPRPRASTSCKDGQERRDVNLCTMTCSYPTGTTVIILVPCARHFCGWVLNIK